MSRESGHRASMEDCSRMVQQLRYEYGLAPTINLVSPARRMNGRGMTPWGVVVRVEPIRPGHAGRNWEREYWGWNQNSHSLSEALGKALEKLIEGAAAYT